MAFVSRVAGPNCCLPQARGEEARALWKIDAKYYLDCLQMNKILTCRVFVNPHHKWAGSLRNWALRSLTVEARYMRHCLVRGFRANVNGFRQRYAFAGNTRPAEG